MHVILTGDHRSVDKQTQPLARALSRPITWTAILSKRARNAVFDYVPGSAYNLFFPLQRAAYQTVFVHGSVELFESGTSLDFLARAMNAVSREGRLYLDAAALAMHAGSGCLTEAMALELLGPPDETVGEFWTYKGRPERLPEDRSILGWYYNQRGTIVETNVTGGLISGKSVALATSLFGDLAYPGATMETTLKRLPRQVINDIARQVRDGTLSPEQTAAVPPPDNVAYTWDWESHGKKFRQYQESWESYLIPGSIYKAASIASMIRRLYPGRRDLSFLEHGGNAGVLTAQLLLDLQDSLALGVCCEIDVVPLLNALNIFHHFPGRLHGRMYVRNAAADDYEYDRKFTVIAFIHMLVYVRRDFLARILSRAWEALEPGGMLLTLENTYPPTPLTGVDAEIMLMRDELEQYLGRFGEIEFASPGTGEAAKRDDGDARPLIRFVRKKG
jgi:SAM-dependent methyltransferase